MNNVALFVTHSVFLTKNDIESLDASGMVEVMGHSVPVWVNASTGSTTEPGEELFCTYRLVKSEDASRDVRLIPKKGYEIFLPGVSEWSEPPRVNYEEIAEWTSERRMALMSEMDKWWFSNPRPQDISNLKNGYLRFDVRKNSDKESGLNPEYHVLEIADVGRLANSLT